MRLRLVYWSTAPAFLFGYWDNKSTLLSPTLNGYFWYKAAIRQHFLLLFAHSPPDSPLNIVPTTLSFLLKNQFAPKLFSRH